ncbi:MAG: CaiB/BaiF CoA transferase family protein [Sphingomonas sp.]
MTDIRPAPLAGRKVLDLSRVLAGPWCTMVLADLGAEVTKVENPKGGDDTRHWGPPYAATESAYYLCANRNKRSIALDISTPEGQEIVRALAADADVLVENYKLGGLDKFGLDYAAIAAINPRIVYCSISGYGRASPIAERPGYDYVIQAEGGLMSITGEVDGQPMKVGVAVADLFTGMAAAQAVLAALIAADRDGVGQHIDMALYDCQLAMLANVGSAALVSGNEPRRFGNGHPTVVPYQVFDTADGRVVIAAGNDRQFAALCGKLLGRPELAADTRFATNAGRVNNREALLAEICPLIVRQTTAWWLDGLREVGVPSGEVRSVGAALGAPEALAREMVVTLPHPSAGEVRIVASPLKLGGTPVVAPIAPPLLGQDTAAVLGELGYDEAAIARMMAASVVA